MFTLSVVGRQPTMLRDVPSTAVGRPNSRDASVSPQKSNRVAGENFLFRCLNIPFGLIGTMLSAIACLIEVAADDNILVRPHLDDVEQIIIPRDSGDVKLINVRKA
jgi:hypothetical protein